MHTLISEGLLERHCASDSNTISDKPTSLAVMLGKKTESNMNNKSYFTRRIQTYKTFTFHTNAQDMRQILD